jgi:hypothetical protein
MNSTDRHAERLPFSTRIVQFLLSLMFLAGCIPLVWFYWVWTVPDLFPVAVEQRYIAKSISWFTATKLVLAIGIFQMVLNAGKLASDVFASPTKQQSRSLASRST